MKFQMKDYAIRYYYILLIPICVSSRVDGDVLKRSAFVRVIISANMLDYLLVSLRNIYV